MYLTLVYIFIHTFVQRRRGDIKNVCTCGGRGNDVANLSKRVWRCALQGYLSIGTATALSLGIKYFNKDENAVKYTVKAGFHLGKLSLVQERIGRHTVKNGISNLYILLKSALKMQEMPLQRPKFQKISKEICHPFSI